MLPQSPVYLYIYPVLYPRIYICTLVPWDPQGISLNENLDAGWGWRAPSTTAKTQWKTKNAGGGDIERYFG